MAVAARLDLHAGARLSGHVGAGRVVQARRDPIAGGEAAPGSGRWAPGPESPASGSGQLGGFAVPCRAVPCRVVLCPALQCFTCAAEIGSALHCTALLCIALLCCALALRFHAACKPSGGVRAPETRLGRGLRFDCKRRPEAIPPCLVKGSDPGRKALCFTLPLMYFWD